jgi:hypothetical protein
LVCFEVLLVRGARRSCGPGLAGRRATPRKLDVSWASSRGTNARGDVPEPVLVPAKIAGAIRRHAATTATRIGDLDGT